LNENITDIYIGPGLAGALILSLKAIVGWKVIMESQAMTATTLEMYVSGNNVGEFICFINRYHLV